MSQDELRKKALELLESHVGMIPGSIPDISKDEIWAEVVKELEDIEK